MYEAAKVLHHQLPFLSPDAALLLLLVTATLLVLAFASLFAGITSVVERKIAGRIQSRLGPNYVWGRGFLQFLADGIKTIQKEDIIPDQADRSLFRLAPYLVFAGMFATWVVIPFGSQLVAADLNIGILYIFAVSSLNVMGILMAGWGSNNKWSLIGGVRSAAQIVSYEVPTGLSALTVILLAGSLSLQQIIRAQGVWPWEWFITSNPFASFAFFIMFSSLLAEGNRVPFDIPEAESELVSGYNTEYSGMRFLVFFFAEWANLYVVSAVLTALFLGGWNSPFDFRIPLLSIPLEITGTFVFLLKASVLTFVIIWIRWTLPRLRVDQLMTVCWKYFTPMAFANLVGSMVWLLFFPEGVPILSRIITGLFALLLAGFAYRIVVVNLIRMNAKIDLNPFH